MIPAKRVTRSASAAAAAAAAIGITDTAPQAESVSKKLKTENETKVPKTRATKAVSKVKETKNQIPSKRSTPESQPTKSRVTRSAGEGKKAEETNELNTVLGIVEGSYLPDDLDPVSTDSGEEVLLQELAKSSGLIIFFYPRANTPGCTVQACGFRDRLPEATSQGYKIYGMSADPPKAQTSWKNKHQLGYTLLCDPEYKVLKRLGIMKQPKGIKRSHMVVEKGGKIKSLKIQIGPKPSVEQALATLTEDSE